jgi:hypothetical protein
MGSMRGWFGEFPPKSPFPGEDLHIRRHLEKNGGWIRAAAMRKPTSAQSAFLHNSQTA